MWLIKRRDFLKKGISIVGGIAACSGIKAALAARVAEHFAGDRFDRVVTRLFGTQAIVDSDQIELNLPEIAENGAVVPLTISSELEGIERFYLLVEKNPTPLAAEFELSGSALAYVSARIKMASSCHVIVIAKCSEQLLRTKRWVEIGQGGCGTG